MVRLQSVDHRGDVGLRFGSERLNARQQTGLVDLTGAERGKDAKEHRHAANTVAPMMQMQLDAARTANCDPPLRTAWRNDAVDPRRTSLHHRRDGSANRIRPLEGQDDHRLCAVGRGTAAGPCRHLADPRASRLGKPDLGALAALHVRAAHAGALRPARLRLVADRRRHHHVRRLGGGPGSRRRPARAGIFPAVRHVARRSGRGGVCDPPPRARHAPDLVRAARDRLARPFERVRTAVAVDGAAGARWMGRVQHGVPVDVRESFPAAFAAGDAAVVRGAATEKRQQAGRRPLHAPARRSRHVLAAEGDQGADARDPDRARASDRSAHGDGHRRRNSGQPVREHRQQQSHPARRRARLAGIQEGVRASRAGRRRCGPPQHRRARAHRAAVESRAEDPRRDRQGPEQPRDRRRACSSAKRPCAITSRASSTSWECRRVRRR